MVKSVVRITTASALALLASCQLNDHDSAPRAPDQPYDDEFAQSSSPAEADTTRGPRNAASAADASTATNAPAQTNATTGDAAVDAGTTPPGFPPIPLLEAGSLPPGNAGTLGDGAVVNPTQLPPTS